MTDYIISSESTMDLSVSYVKKLGVSVINSNYQIDGEVYLDDFGQSLDMDSFYKKMQEGSMTSTSAINIEEYLTYFRPILDKGCDIIHVSLSSGMSVQGNFLSEAKRVLKDEYPQRKIYLVDSLMASSGIGLLVDKLVELKNSGMDIDSLYEKALEYRNHVLTLVTNEDLSYAARGGRISKTAASIGGLLHISPLVEIDNEGKLQVSAKIRTRKKFLNTIINKIKENGIESNDYSEKIFISHASNEQFALEAKAMLEEEFDNLKEEIRIFNIGPTIGSHIGPGTLAIFYWGKERYKVK
ncbi:MAG: DegV family protein [Tissierellia bacterium]|nr:DegV family protein [Tissierellia bacterium]